MFIEVEPQNIPDNIPDHWRDFANAAKQYIKKRKPRFSAKN